MSDDRWGYQYVVLRCVPDVVREEFVNVGVVLYSQQASFLDVGWELDEARLQAISPVLDVTDVESCLDEAAEVCRGKSAPGRPVLDRLGQRFGWLTAPRSTVLQPGPIHGGVTDDPQAELRRLVQVLVSPPSRITHPPATTAEQRRPLQ